MSLFSRISKLVKRTALNPATLKAMRESDDAHVRALAEVFGRTLAETLSDLEKVAIAEIEGRRTALLQRTDAVEEVDYGAGTPDSAPRLTGTVSVGTIRVADACRRYSRAGPSSLLLFNIVRVYKPKTGLELGACLGLSASYQAAAMKCNGGGRFLTLEGAPALASRNLLQ